MFHLMSQLRYEYCRVFPALYSVMSNEGIAGSLDQWFSNCFHAKDLNLRMDLHLTDFVPRFFYNVYMMWMMPMTKTIFKSVAMLRMDGILVKRNYSSLCCGLSSIP